MVEVKPEILQQAVVIAEEMGKKRKGTKGEMIHMAVIRGQGHLDSLTSFLQLLLQQQPLQRRVRVHGKERQQQ